MRTVFKILGLLLSKGYENRLFGIFLGLRALGALVVTQQFFIKSVYLLIQSSLGLLQRTQHVAMLLSKLLLWLRSQEKRVVFLLKLHRSSVFGLKAERGGITGFPEESLFGSVD